MYGSVSVKFHRTRDVYRGPRYETASPGAKAHGLEVSLQQSGRACRLWGPLVEAAMTTITPTQLAAPRSNYAAEAAVR